MNKKEEKVRKRDLALQSFYRKVQKLVKELESKYQELELNGKSGRAKNGG